MDVVIDLDGTLADITHRRHLVVEKPTDWAKFQALAHLDLPNGPIATLVKAMVRVPNPFRIILCSGRGEQERPVTEAWLRNHEIYYSRLYMRTAKDYRADDVIKEELLDRMLADGFKPELVFDDRDRVVAMWRRRGLVCCQVAEGNF